jgi:hypothetical protein
MTQGLSDSVAVSIADCLLERAARTHVGSVLAGVPPAALSSLCWEFRLAATMPRVDVIVGIDRRTRWALRPNYWTAADTRHAPAVWNALWRMSERWGADAPEYRHVDAVWLEFDVHEEAKSRLPHPSVLIGVRPRDGRDARNAARLLAAFGPASTRSIDADLTRCYELLPTVSHIRYIGVMSGRQTVTTRLCIQGMPLDALAPYLCAIGWRGDIAAVQSTANTLAALSSYRSQSAIGLVHLDLAGGLLSTIGIEWGFTRDVQRRGRWEDTFVLDYLVDQGLCDANKRDGLLQWPGHQVTNFDHDLWPSVVVRWVNNVKIVFEAAGARTAKGYLCAAWRPSSEVREAGASGARTRAA